MSLTFNVSGFQAVPVDVPVRLSGFLERGRPRPLNPPLMQIQPVLAWLERRALGASRCIKAAVVGSQPIHVPLHGFDRLRFECGRS